MALIPAFRRLRSRVLRRVFVRSTVYMAVLLTVFALLIASTTLYLQTAKLEIEAREHASQLASTIAPLAARELVQGNYDILDAMMSSLAVENHVVSVRTYAKGGFIVASDEASRRRLRSSMIDVDVLRSILDNTPALRENSGRIELI